MQRRCRQQRFELIECEQGYRRALLARDVRRRDVVRDAIGPGANRAATVERRKAAPQREMDVLQQVAAFVPIRFVAASQAAERRPELIASLRVQLVLLCVTTHFIVSSRTPRPFLTT